MKRLLFACPVALLLFACGGQDAKKPAAQAVAKDSVTVESPSDTVTAPAMDTAVPPTSPAAAATAIPLRFNLQPGKQYGYGMRMEMQQQMGERSMNNTMEMAYRLAVLDEKQGLRTIRASYDRIVMSMKMGEMKLDFSSENPAPEGAATDPMQLLSRMFAAMKGKSFVLKVDEKGEVKSVDGLKEIGQQLVKEMNLPENLRPAMARNFESQFNENSVRQSFSQTFSIFPQKPVKVGDSWTRQVGSTRGGAPDATSTYTLRAVNSNLATVDAVSSENVKEGKMTNTNRARLYIDTRTGLVTRGSFEQEMQGAMKMKSKGTITGRELN